MNNSIYTDKQLVDLAKKNMSRTIEETGFL